MAPSFPSKAVTVESRSLETAQPIAPQTMSMSLTNLPTTSTNTEAQKAQAEEQELNLRGGDACPGRFCFIIPCPIPCNFCII